VTAGFEVGHFDLGGLAVPHIPDVRAQFAPLLQQWQRAGLLALDGDVARLTVPGRFWYSNLIAAFNDIITSAGPASDAARAGPPPFRNRPTAGGPA
jgi:oxygen-independent coproporphyrinogen-3 oxidase